ncbi:MAG TPA: hypothetical protein VF598_14330, partial [Hymenobacter sp.]
MVPKYLSILGTSLLAATGVLAQIPAPTPLANVHLGLGGGLMGSGDYFCQKTYVEYAPTFGQLLGTGTRLAYISGDGGGGRFGRLIQSPTGGNVSFVELQYSQSYQALNLEHEFYFFPLGNDKRLRPYIGAGGFVGHSKQYYYPEEQYDPASGTYSYDFLPTRGYQVGYLFSLNLD